MSVDRDGRRPEKTHALKTYGADHVIDHSREDAAARVAEITAARAPT